MALYALFLLLPPPTQPRLIPRTTLVFHYGYIVYRRNPKVEEGTESGSGHRTSEGQSQNLHLVWLVQLLPRLRFPVSQYREKAGA